MSQSTKNEEKVGAQLPPQPKYRAFAPVHLPNRTWPDKTITRAPIWCSVDLRDGNQALAIPMSIDEKLEMFALLCEIGFKEIEIGFPSASQIEFDFCRRLIDENLIPGDVTVQVLVQAREELIRRSFEALRGAKRAVMHQYTPTNPVQRRVVFGNSKEQTLELAKRGAELIRQLANEYNQTEWVYEFTPETFVLTELEFSLEVCEAVSKIWNATPSQKIILNLPTTVESSTPNVHADQIEWFCRHLSNRENAIISLHTHNDRGTGVASTELALLAGAERVEGTLFGNGERTGNLDIVTVALNLFSQGVASNLDFSELPRIREIYERTTRMDVHARHPYAGDLTFTAFSGSHQDAINKGFAAQKPDSAWEVPYLPIDPKDIGRNYEAIIRYNSQSGKGGVAFLLEQNYGFDLPKGMRVEFGKIMNDYADKLGREIAAEEIYARFQSEYLELKTPFELVSFRSGEREEGVKIAARVRRAQEVLDLVGQGNGPIDAFVSALSNANVGDFTFKSYAEHSLGDGANSQAASYIAIERDGKTVWGAGVDSSIERASIKAVLCALNRS
ncbi:2-isopropylmalate synthase [Abditibacterium utsteinense]|uniref:2-isopropylmalate synthase n=1 Tax=Abditibacterium utsteinense TaxID=1960156 RepID=A0A2S8SUK7_9BACT|nr:2-isopropylmalate synthase [Abditibacterium utsteinense]PQV64481.1 2-isopropylmalate synthase [Abditibacterium utsteinense]